MSGWSELGEERVYSELRQRLIDHNPDDERFSNGFHVYSHRTYNSGVK